MHQQITGGIYMRKLTICILFLLVSLPAYSGVTLLENETSKVELYGTIRGYIGYDMSYTNYDGSKNVYQEELMYGLQTNSRIGVNFSINNFFGTAEIGAKEKTFLNSSGDTIGFRWFFAGYKFGNAGSILFGKTDTPSSIGGYNSDIFNIDGGANGFGGIMTGNRRIQLMYKTPFNLDISLITLGDMAVSSANKIEVTGGEIPRLSLGYNYSNERLSLKAAASYGAAAGKSLENASASALINAFHIGFAVKPVFNKFYLSLITHYGMNADIYNEQTTYGLGNRSTAYTFGSNLFTAQVNNDGSINNVSRFGINLEMGYQINEVVSVIVSGGYQITMMDKQMDFNGFGLTDFVNSYSAFLQVPFKISRNFSIITQVGWYSNSAEVNDGSTFYEESALLAGAQIRYSF